MSVQISEKSSSHARNRHAPIAESLAQQLDAAFADFQGKWIAFNSAVHLRDDADLASKIELFSMPLRKVYERTYPLLANGSDETFWLMLLTAVLRSKTHSRDTLAAAISELRQRRG